MARKKNSRRGLSCRYTFGTTKAAPRRKWLKNKEEVRAAARAHADAKGTMVYVFRKCARKSKLPSVRIGECTKRSCKWY